jgi:chromosome segregation ATPase
MTQAIIEVLEPDAIIKQFGVDTTGLDKAKSEYAGIDAATSDGYKLAVRGRALFRDTRVGIEKRRKELKADALAYGRNVDECAKNLTALVEPTETELDAKIKAVDSEKARIKQAEETRKREELEAKVRAEQEAEAARLLAIRKEEERKLAAERKRLAAEQLRLDAQRREQEEAARVERERMERELAEARAKIAEEQRLSKLAADAEAERVRLERKREREAQEKEDLERAENLKKLQAESASEMKRLSDERAALEAEKFAAERAERERREKQLAEEQAKQRAEQLAREAEEYRVAEAERQAALAARLEALKPDREKLFAYSVALLEVTCSELKDDEAKAFLVAFQDDLAELTFKLEAWGAQGNHESAPTRKVEAA